MKRYFQLSDFYDNNGNFRLTDVGLANIQTLAEIVMNSHYAYCSKLDKEDLQQVGVEKAFELLSSGSFDPTRSSLKNYLYTGMRNEMKNYLYRSQRDMSVDDEIITNTVESKQFNPGEVETSIEIPDSLIKKSVGRFLRHGIKLEDVKSSLKSIGFDVEGDVEPVYVKEVDSVVCLVIWERLKR